MSEIRDLHAGEYNSADGSSSLRISKTDQGVRIEIADFVFDLWEAWTLADGKIQQFEWGTVSQANKEDMKRKND